MESSKKMKIVIRGATGLTGHGVLDQALNDEHEVKAVARNPEQNEDLFSTFLK